MKKCDNNSKLKKLCSFKHRDTSWQSTEPKALEICDTQLYQFVQEEDLFAREAQYHASCENQFKLNCLKYQKSKEKASESLPPSTEQSKIITANQDVLTFVVHEIQSSLNQSNKNCATELSSITVHFKTERKFIFLPSISWWQIETTII